MTHTPRPWRTEPEPQLHNDWVVLDNDNTYIAYIPEVTTAEERANARLIAASPTMYEYIKSRAREGDEDALDILEEINDN